MKIDIPFGTALAPVEYKGTVSCCHCCLSNVDCNGIACLKQDRVDGKDVVFALSIVNPKLDWCGKVG